MTKICADNQYRYRTYETIRKVPSEPLLVHSGVVDSVTTTVLTYQLWRSRGIRTRRCICPDPAIIIKFSVVEP
jgi:hypothetical protein